MPDSSASNYEDALFERIGEPRAHWLKINVADIEKQDGSLLPPSAGRDEPGAGKPRLDEVVAELDRAKRELALVYASTSWKLTRPLRTANVTVRNYFRSVLARVLTWLALAAMKRYPFGIVHLIRLFERRLLGLAIVRPLRNGSDQRPASSVWFIDPDPDAVSDWEKIAYGASRKINGSR